MAYHLLSEKVKALQCAHGLRARRDVSEHDVCLAAHLGRSHGHDVENGAVGREERVQRHSQVWLLDLVGEVGAVQSGIVSIVCDEQED